MRNTLSQGGGVFNTAMAPTFKAGWGLSEAELGQLPGWRQPKEVDLQEARRLLTEAGYPNGLKTTIRFDQTNSFLPYMTEVTLNQVRKVGFDASGIPQENAVASQTGRDGTYEMRANGQGLSETPNQNGNLRNEWRSSGADARVTGINDPKLDELIDRQAGGIRRGEA
jgi:ABC-type transport system substrate-binding protein